MGINASPNGNQRWRRGAEQQQQIPHEQQLLPNGYAFAKATPRGYITFVLSNTVSEFAKAPQNFQQKQSGALQSPLLSMGGNRECSHQTNADNKPF